MTFWPLSETVELGKMSFTQDVCGELTLQRFQPRDESPALPCGLALQQLHCLWSCCSLERLI